MDPNQSPLSVFGSDPNLLLKELYRIYPHPDIARLIEYYEVP